MSYKVKLRTFEGPFDLLVYLIENAEMSIYDIEISEITSQYLEYIRTMREMDVYVASEFMVLASSLIEIKSRMILPRVNTAGETLVEEDPRSELVARLLEYKKFKRAAAVLEEREARNQRIYEKPQEDISAYLEQPDEYLRLDLRQFANAFTLFLSKKQRVEAVRRHYTRVERERARMEERIFFIAKTLRQKLGETFSFKRFIHHKEDRYDIVVTFMSLLEMAKNHMVRVQQEYTYGDIQVSAGERIEDALAAAGDGILAADSSALMAGDGAADKSDRDFDRSEER